MADPEDTFVARWSRRKRGESRRVESEKQSGAMSGEPVATEPSEDEIVAQLPDIDSLDESADFTVFLQKGVPEELRKRALRRLWRLNPVFANLDGLAEYDEDYNTVTTLLEGVKTIYQVGKGMPGPAEEERDEVQADEQKVDGVQAGESESSQTADHTTESAPQEIAETPSVPVAELREGEAVTEDSEAAAAEDQDQTAGKASGRSAVERRWGRSES